MKKFLLISSIATVLIVLSGMMIVFDFFDFSKGNSQLIGLSSSATEGHEMHNKIVAKVHQAGNLARDINGKFYGMAEDSNVAIFTDSVKNLGKSRKSLEKQIESASFKGSKKEIKEEFFNNYLPALKSFESTALDTAIYYKDRGFSGENRELFINRFSSSYKDFTEEHNRFSDILNSNRRY
jgi:pantothenate kinase-related protein Tda10